MVPPAFGLWVLQNCSREGYLPRSLASRCIDRSAERILFSKNAGFLIGFRVYIGLRGLGCS